MQQELKRYFSIAVQNKKQLVKCLVLKRTSGIDKLRSKGGNRKTNLWSIDSVFNATNIGFDEFVQVLKISMDYNSTSTPFINATNYVGKIDIKIKNAISPILDIPSLRKELRKYDLDLVEENWLTDVLVINEKKKNL
jgi:hypothetical protein